MIMFDSSQMIKLKTPHTLWGKHVFSASVNYLIPTKEEIGDNIPKRTDYGIRMRITIHATGKPGFSTIIIEMKERTEGFYLLYGKRGSYPDGIKSRRGLAKKLLLEVLD